MQASPQATAGCLHFSSQKKNVFKLRPQPEIKKTQSPQTKAASDTSVNRT